MFLVNSRLGRCAATPARFSGKRTYAPGHPFSRSYGAKLPSSLTGDHSTTLGRLPLPTCVGLRYGRLCNWTTRLFLPAWAQLNRFDRSLRFPRTLRLTRGGICLPPDAYGARTDHVQWARSTYPSGFPLRLVARQRRGRNNNRLSIGLGFMPYP